MANLDFYALEDDLRSLFQFLYAETDIVTYELSSDFDREVRQFTTLAELESVYNLGSSRAGHFQLWSPKVMPHPVIRRIELKVSGHSFRYTVEGAGLIQLYLDGGRDGVIYHTHFGHWSEAGARRGSMHSADDCNWPVLARLSGRIQRHIRNELAVAKLHARHILHHALKALQQGDGLCFGPNIHKANSPDIKLLPPT